MHLSFKQKTDNYTAFLAAEAAKIGCVFLEDSGEGRDLETDTMSLEDVTGWLVPLGTPPEEGKTDDNYCCAEWKIGDNHEISIEFVHYDISF